ncbi:unnamed protein product [Lactuca saligna]|uniref:E3 ubiquitin-protein ligase listerin n=1 Tax=Lactuca saligna TaxID=75948 RepID=A0AA35ZV78_LACSI|nr:unnamed protein product [Lactuca saligna]
MGRQKGEAARSKARPSSSSLAASLLPSGATAVGFGGYVGSSRIDTSTPITQDTDSPFLDIDAELAQHLKRLARKDPTTKLKALTTLSTLLKQKSAKDVSPIIPQWAFEYKKLLLDYNREVRRATHETMANLVSTVGRELAPHLKSLMGPWWFSQFDAVHEVSQAAKRSFQAAFPVQEKRLDALMLCTDDVFMYLEENLKLTPQSMSDKAVALDELQEMHQQVISSSLLSLATLLDILTNEKHASENSNSELKHALKARSTAISHAEKLISVHKCFMEFLKSSSPAIRSAAYSLIRSYIKNIPHALNEANIKTLSPSILGAFQEKDPTCHSSMWEAILLFSRRFPESWNTLSVQKIVLNRFWSFLRNGCFGSRQVSYPALVLFLDCVPDKAITKDRFFLEFFQSFWGGKGHSESSNADQLAFFKSYCECFLWALQNAERYCEGLEEIHQFQHTLVDEVLLKLLWHDYLMVPVSRQLTNIDHIQEFGKCITEILSSLFSLNPNLLSSFCSTFEENCLNAFQQTENSENIEKIIRFLLLVDKHAVQKDDSWPLSYLVGPMLPKSFKLIQTIDSSNAVKFMVVAVSTFGPRKVVQEIVQEQNKDMNLKQFLQYYKDIFVPWCLQTNSSSILARLDLLLALLDDECFSEQWDCIVLHATGIHDSDHTLVLTLLMEKTREEIIKRKVDPKNWHHELLDSTALLITHSSPPFGSSNARYIRAVLGGITEEDQIILLSKNTSILIFEEIFQKLQTFIQTSNFTWVRNANSLLNVEKHVTINEHESVLEIATFSLEVLKGTFFRLKSLTQNPHLLPSILAVLFVIDWEHAMSALFYDGVDDVAYAKVVDRIGFCKSVHDYRCEMNTYFKTLSLDCQRVLGGMLVQVIRWGVVNEEKLDVDKVTSLGCLFVLEVLDSLCEGQIEEQMLLDELLKKDDSWPLWIVPDIKNGQRSGALKVDIVSSNASECHQMASFVDKLISKLGISRVIAGFELSMSSSNDVATHHPHYPRAWLAAEMLCTWKWDSGSALSSFLPSLIQYTKNQDSCFTNNLFDPIVQILLDGALEKTIKKLSFFGIYPAPHDELESIEEVFVRSLVAILNTLFGGNIWGKEKAFGLFNLLVDRLFVGEDINLDCLKILPVVMSVLIGPLSSQDDESGNDENDPLKGNQINDIIKGWLERILSFPPLNTWESGEDKEDWFHLVMSCYPIRPTKGMQDFKPQRHITQMERSLLLKLLRNQRFHSATYNTVNKLPVVQMLLSKLTVVTIGYCWTEFNEEDWEFLLYKSRWWIESSVVSMEEIAESVNDIITGTSNSNSGVPENLRRIVSDFDSIPLKLATNALIAFSMFRGLIRKQTTENENENENENDSNPLRAEKFDAIKDRILEGILRLFFSTGATEAIAGSYSSEGSLVISSSRLDDGHFWELVGSSVVDSSVLARDRAIKSFEIWGLSKGAVSSLYSILFTEKPVPCLQYAAYVILSSQPVSDSAFMIEDSSSSLDETEKDPHDLSLTARLRDEVSRFLEKPSEILYLDLVAPERVNVFLAWSLLISHLLSSSSSTSSSSSRTREKLIQHIQDSSNSTILDCIFQHVPLELCTVNIKKKLSELPEGIAEVAAAATRAITDSSVLFAVESLWPVGPDGMASFAGAIYGLMLTTVPAYVRGWFNDIRDRTTSSAIESFTRAWCSPPLITNELSQIKKANLCDENFSVSVSKSVNEVVATYTKDETGMDLVIRLPASYSLRPVDVECTRSLGISEVKQRKWLLSMMSFVRNQNGALAEAIGIWKSNFDKEFEGVEECPICYSVIHTANHSLPRLACRTCKHKFHSACLYKWFSTSHKSNCPLCQSPF